MKFLGWSRYVYAGGGLLRIGHSLGNSNKFMMEVHFEAKNIKFRMSYLVKSLRRFQ